MNDKFDTEALRAANINPKTLLATDYLNHFNEAAMLLDMLSADPEVCEDFLEWSPMSYVDHARKSCFSGSTLVVEAWDHVEPDRRDRFNTITSDADTLVVRTQEMIRCSNLPEPDITENLYALISDLSAIISGTDSVPGSTNDPETPGAAQDSIDALFS